MKVQSKVELCVLENKSKPKVDSCQKGVADIFTNILKMLVLWIAL